MLRSFMTKLAPSKQQKTVSDMASSDSSHRQYSPSPQDRQSHQPKLQAYDQTALEITVTPPTTSQVVNQQPPPAFQEMKSIRQAKSLRLYRLGLMVLSIAMSAAVVGCTAHIMAEYKATSFTEEWALPLWPADLDMRPTQSLLIPAALIAALSLIYSVFSLLPSHRSKSTFLNVMFALTSIFNILIAAAAVLYTALKIYYINPKVNEQETIQSFTCQIYHGAVDYTKDTSNSAQPFFHSLEAPLGFQRLCYESQAAFGITAALILVGLTSLVASGMSFWCERKIKKASAAQQAERDEKWFQSL